MEHQSWASRCPRCAATTPLDDGVTGCRQCRAAGVGMPMVPFRSVGPEPVRPGAAPVGFGAMWRWAAHLVPVGTPVTLGEGGTPLVRLDAPGLPGLPGLILLKDERANPTGSFKDRLASATVSRARHLGADTVVVASTGNAGLAVAAYAAAARLGCVLLASQALPAATGAAVEALGARVLLTETFTDRWTSAQTGVEQLGWFPVTNYLTPPVASHPVGVQAYRTIAFEIAESLDWAVPDWVVVPVSRGDGLFGIWSGFVELAELGWTSKVPRMMAVERHPSLTDALARHLEQPELVRVDGQVKARSISDPQGAGMSVHSIRASGGDALVGDDEQIQAAWERLAAGGVLLELSSAAVLHGAQVLADRGAIDGESTVVLLATAGPYSQQTLNGQPAGRRVEDPTDADALRAATAQSTGA